jgi:hypothetical protein
MTSWRYEFCPLMEDVFLKGDFYYQISSIAPFHPSLFVWVGIVIGHQHWAVAVAVDSVVWM